MLISIAEAQGQLLELVRRAVSGEEVLLTHEGKTIGQISAARLDSPTAAWSGATRDERLKIIRDIVERAPRKRAGDPDAAHSQDFLYDESGLPA